MPVTNVGIIKPWDEGTVSAGAEIADDGALQNKDQRLLNERWDVDPSNPAIWGDIITGAAAINVNEDGVPVSHIELDKGNSTSVAVRFLKQTIDITQPFRIKIAMRKSSFSSIGFALMLSGYSADPTAGDLGNRLTFNWLQSSLTAARIHYFTSGGVQTEWDEGGSNWNTGTRLTTFELLVWKYAYLISDGTTWHIELENENGSQQTSTTPVTWANTKALGGGESAYLVLGDVLNSTGSLLDAMFASVEIWPTEAATTYLTSAETGETVAYAISENFDSDDITVQLDRTPASAPEIKVAANIDGAGFGPFINVDVTPIVGQKGLFKFAAGTSFTPGSSVVLKVQINSPDTSTRLRILSVKIDGVTIAGAVCDYPAETDVRLNVDYDSGNLTGSAAIPGASDVRDGVAVDATTGTYEPADEADVLLDVQYGADGTESTGSLLRYAVPTDASDTLRQRIMDTIETRMGTILVSNGFKTNVGQNVFPWSELGINNTKLPALIIRDVDDDPDQEVIRIVDNILTVQVIALTTKSATSEQEVREIIADVIKAVGVDETWGDLAEFTLLPPAGMEALQLEKKLFGSQIDLVVEYTTGRFDPFGR